MQTILCSIGYNQIAFLGIFPREPNNRKKANKGSSAPTSFYYTKDIAYLAHEPVLKKLRDHKAFAKKLSRALGRGEWSSAKSLEDNKPIYRLDHIIKERYVSEVMFDCFLTFLPLDIRLSLTLCETSTMLCAWYFSFLPYPLTLVFPLKSLRTVRDFLQSGSYT